MKSLLITIAIAMTMLLSGCAGVFLLGAGVGAGAFSYIAGNLTRVYEADYQKSVQVSLNVMEQRNLTRKEESDEELKTILEGFIYYDTPITIQVVYIDAVSTQISVRTGYVGVDNLEISEQVHADIAEEFKRIKPSTMQAASQKKRLDTPRLKATAKKQYYKPADDQAKVFESEGAPPPMSEIVSAPMENGRDGLEEMEGRQEEQTLSYTEMQQDKSAGDQAKVSENESAVPPMPEIVSAPVESDRDAPEEMKGRQEKKVLSPASSKNKAFVFYPKSALTIHSGANGALDDIISFLEVNPSARVDIRAYTDSSGNFSRNLALSQKRVSEVRNYLILHDIPDEIITAEILESANFPENNRTEAQSRLTHRVEITVSNEHDIPPPRSATVSVPMESDIAGRQVMKGRQEEQTLSLTPSKNKSFIFYPKSPLTIHSGSNGALGDVISFLDENPPERVDIRAYTDSSGNFSRNLALSQKRVSEVRNYLILHDIADEIITAQILEAANFLENNRPEAQNPLTHRVEIIIR